MEEREKRKKAPGTWGTGHGQLTLVEHSLCPLDTAISLAENLIHSVKYHFTDKNRHLQTAVARVFCPLGLSPNDELFLWGLLSLTLSQPQAGPEFFATPHYCLRQLGLIDHQTRRGGRQYQQFADSLTRLAAVVYQNDRFYDPVRAEHRHVSFGFLSYSLPLDPESSRAWRISWNPLFFEMVQAASGGFRFDLKTYRGLEPASRRLFLLLSKIFQRRATSPQFDLHNLACDVLGFSPSIAAADLKKKIRRCVDRLGEVGVVASGDETDIFEKQGAGRYRILLHRGPYFARKGASSRLDVSESALSETLGSLGVEASTARRVIEHYPARLLQEWADITLAARERFGQSFFRKSAAAYFIDNVKNAAVNQRTPPDWWLELRKAEVRARAVQDRRNNEARAEKVNTDEQSGEAREVFTRVMGEIFNEFQAAGQSPEIAMANARRFAAEHVKRLVQKKQNAASLVESLRSGMTNPPKA